MGKMYKWNEGKTAVDQDEAVKWPRNRDVSLLCSLAFVIHASAFLLRLIRNCTCHFWQKKLDNYRYRVQFISPNQRQQQQ